MFCQRPAQLHHTIGEGPRRHAGRSTGPDGPTHLFPALLPTPSLGNGIEYSTSPRFKKNQGGR
eukprot:scaffold100788_cov32-Tisochrysis_lutea.AAC.3